MAKQSLIQDSINKRLEEERYVIPKEKKKRKQINLQMIVMTSIILGLIISVIRLIPYFIK